jgi:hypothetical protein
MVPTEMKRVNVVYLLVLADKKWKRNEINKNRGTVVPTWREKETNENRNADINCGNVKKNC